MNSGRKTVPWLLAGLLALWAGASWWSPGGTARAATPPENQAEPAEGGQRMPPLPPGAGAERPERFQRGGRSQRPGPWMWRRMNDKERQELRAFMAETFPERFDEFSDLEGADRETFMRMMGRIVPEMVRLKELRDRDPEAFEVRVQEMKAQFAVRRLARRYRFTDNAEKKRAMAAEIRELAAKLFDLRNTRERLELERLEKRLDHMQSKIAEREANRAENIDRMVHDILSGRPPRNMDRGPDSPGDRLHAVPEGGTKRHPGEKSRRRPRQRHERNRQDKD